MLINYLAHPPLGKCNKDVTEMRGNILSLKTFSKVEVSPGRLNYNFGYIVFLLPRFCLSAV